MLKIFKKLRKRNPESGRSMVEMLGVLAVISVLTMGGLIGYNHAMNKYRTNLILNEINQRLVVAKQQATVGLPLNMSEFDEHIFGDVKITASMDSTDPDVVYFELENIPEAVASMLVSSGSALWKLPLAYIEGWKQDGVVAQNTYHYPTLTKEAKAWPIIIVAGLVGLGIGAFIIHEGKAACDALPGGKNAGKGPVDSWLWQGTRRR